MPCYRFRMILRFLVLTVWLTAAAFNIAAIAADQLPRFVLHQGNVAAWHETKNGFRVELTETGRREIETFSKAHANRRASLFIETTHFADVTINEPISSRKVEIAVDIEKRDYIRRLLVSKQEQAGPFQPLD